MQHDFRPEIYLSNSEFKHQPQCIQGEYVHLLGEEFYCIRNYDQMPPFFMSIVSNSDLWMFISSTGGLSAGRKNAESSLFPYYTDDKITENSANTGHLAIAQIKRRGKNFLWEPFSNRYPGLYLIQRNLYKNIYGNRIVYEEVNLDLKLSYRYGWQACDELGFINSYWIKNQDEDSINVNLLAGLQNILPYGASTSLQTTLSNLLNAYKRNELESKTGIGLFSLSSTLTDLAEASESLKCTTVWQTGLESPLTLLSTGQVDHFRQGGEISQEFDICGRRGAYLVNQEFLLEPKEEKTWDLIAEVNQDASHVVALVNTLELDGMKVRMDISRAVELSTRNLKQIISSVDGLQLTNDKLSSYHHYSNVLYNTMRGGYFPQGYALQKEDFNQFVQVHNKNVFAKESFFLEQLPANINLNSLLNQVLETDNASLVRLCYEYLPLAFSRRHGDPSRPWNQFSINLKNPDGSQRLDYQGNWRDIFQNWEPLAWSFPDYIESMVCKFINATTLDGYNPYRINRDGIEWEVLAPDHPWANIGYWGDHQIIYLQKLLELSVEFHPGSLEALFNSKIFSTANIPYRIKTYPEIVEDSYNTIQFDWELNHQIESLVEQIGTDGRLLLDENGEVFHRNLGEKLLVLLLIKLGNFVPGGGIWMNTQRPEWNDANNALVGRGLSIVTLCYLRRFTFFLSDLSMKCEFSTLEISQETLELFQNISKYLNEHLPWLNEHITDHQRRQLMDGLGNASSEYRWKLYNQGFSGNVGILSLSDIQTFLQIVIQYLDQSILTNRRSDNLFHSYNILHLDETRANITHLDEMLEGQVAVLSSGLLSADESVSLLEKLRNSRLYRADQHSYLLYPDRSLPGFMEKNNLTQEQVARIPILDLLIGKNDGTLLIRDEDGKFHFNGDFRNAKDVSRRLNELQNSGIDPELIEEAKQPILDLFEETFNHSAYTGRSGTFFAFEGLGSIYWHMVSKLLLAVQESFLRAYHAGESQSTLQKLSNIYYDIRQGLGFNKTPDVYGAFPTDPYSHTPAGEGAKQPGMTGQVKEEILTRWGELGIKIENGVLSFNPILLRNDEFLDEPGYFEFFDVNSKIKRIEIPADSLVFTFCQVPIILTKNPTRQILVEFSDNKTELIPGNRLTYQISQEIFNRSSIVSKITVFTQPGIF